MNKKTFTMLIACVAIIFSFTACHKEGVYNPKKKISKIYVGLNKSLSEIWTWKGKKLQKIDHLIWTENFSYDNKNRIQRVESFQTNERIDYKYNGDHIGTASYYFEGTLNLLFAFSYNGNKISKIDVTDYTDHDVNEYKQLRLNPLRFIIPEVVWKEVDNQLKKEAASGKGTPNTVTINYEWDGKNVSRMTLSQEGYSIYSDYMYKKYDNKMNPYWGFYGDSPSVLQSYNNVLELVAKSETETALYTFTYEYDGKFPTMVRSQQQEDLWYIDITYFEYK